MLNIYKAIVKKLRSRPRPRQEPGEPPVLIEWADLPPHHPRSERD